MALAAPDLSLTSLKDTLYLTGGEVIIDEPTSRDVIIAAGSVEINAPITGDIIITAGSVTINAPISGDLTIASGKASINADITGDLSISGAATTIQEGVTIIGDSDISGETLDLKGTLNGNLNLNVENIQTSTTAKIIGDLTSSIEPDNQDLVQGDLILTTNKTLKENIVNKIGNTAWQVLVLYAIGIISLLIFGSYTESVTQKMANGPFMSFGSGLLFLVLIPILILILIISVIGIPIALFIALATALTIFLSITFTSLTLGHILLYKLLNFKLSSYIEMLVGVILFVILIKLPVVGIILMIYGVCAGLGAAILSLVWFSRKKGKKTFKGRATKRTSRIKRIN